MSAKTDQQYADLMTQLWKDREKPKPVDWQAKWVELKDLVCTESFMSPLHDKIMLLTRDAEKAYRYNDVTVFDNCCRIIRQMKEDDHASS